MSTTTSSGRRSRTRRISSDPSGAWPTTLYPPSPSRPERPSRIRKSHWATRALRTAHQEFATARWTTTCTRSTARSAPKRVGWRSKSRRIALPHGRSRRMQSGFARPRYPSGHLAGRADPRAARPERTRTWSSRRGEPAGTAWASRATVPWVRPRAVRCSRHRDAVCRRAPSRSVSSSASIAPISSCAGLWS
jgi:hypothetical protein